MFNNENHRMITVGKNLWVSSSPTTPATAGSPTAAYTG